MEYCNILQIGQFSNSHHLSPVNLFQPARQLQNIFQTPPLCWQKDKKGANTRKVCNVGNVERQKFGHNLSRRQILCHYHISPSLQVWPPGVKRQKKAQTRDPIHLVADGSISVNCPIIITLYGSPNGPTRVQLAFSAKSWKYDIAGGGEKLSPSQCLETSKMK